MESNFTYREIQAGEEAKICELVIDCFNEFVAPGYSQEGVDEFSKYVSPAALNDRLKNAESFVIIACHNEQFVGVVDWNCYLWLNLSGKPYENTMVKSQKTFPKA